MLHKFSSIKVYDEWYYKDVIARQELVQFISAQPACNLISRLRLPDKNHYIEPLFLTVRGKYF